MKADAIKRALLLNSLHQDAFTVLQTGPGNPESSDLKELVKKLDEYYTKKSVVFVERFQFYGATKIKSESAQEWSVRLNDEKKDITSAQVSNTAIIEESAMAGILECDVEMKQEPREAELNWVSKRRVPNQEKNRKTNAAIRSHTTSAAGSSGLSGGWAVPGGSEGGRSGNVKCFRCGKGHYVNKCPYPEYQDAHEDVEEEYAPVLCSRQKSDKPIIVDISLNGASIKMELDSGAAMSILPLNLYRKYFVIQEVSDTNVTLINFSGDKIHPEGTVILQVTFNSSEKCREDFKQISDEHKKQNGRRWKCDSCSNEVMSVGVNKLGMSTDPTGRVQSEHITLTKIMSKLIQLEKNYNEIHNLYVQQINVNKSLQEDLKEAYNFSKSTVSNLLICFNDVMESKISASNSKLSNDSKIFSEFTIKELVSNATKNLKTELTYLIANETHQIFSAAPRTENLSTEYQATPQEKSQKHFDVSAVDKLSRGGNKLWRGGDNKKEQNFKELADNESSLSLEEHLSTEVLNVQTHLKCNEVINLTKDYKPPPNIHPKNFKPATNIHPKINSTKDVPKPDVHPSCSTLPIDIAKMKHETLLDPALKDISSHVRRGWPSNSRFIQIMYFANLVGYFVAKKVVLNTGSSLKQKGALCYEIHTIDGQAKNIDY
ncbi:hypothetical protein JTB14_007363 [Gonioctena quinquepunctata]|nr:hypothetical protein JTB14_007363 [Gonioctena quinquepunctata]